MNHRRYKLCLLNLILLVTASLCQADDYVPGTVTSQEASDAQAAMSSLTTDLLNLGGYLGFNLGTTPSDVSSTLLNSSTITGYEQAAFLTMFGAMTVNTFSAALAYFVPSSNSGTTSYSSLNAAANNTFNNPPYSTPSPSTISVSPLIDQPVSTQSSNGQSSYLADPVNQYNLNLLTTPDYSYCMSYNASNWNYSGTPNNLSCSYLYDFQVMSNVIGTLPSTNSVFTYDYVSPYISQLNVNTLVAPLELSTQTSNESSNSSTSSSTQGLSTPEQSQAQQAANFIRYVTGAISPLLLAQMSNYDSLYTQATTPMTSSSSSLDIINTKAAQSALANYLTSLRIYAAQSSIPVSNFYWILSKRLQQTQSSSSTTMNSGSNGSAPEPTSQALSEYQMASWRIANPNQSGSNQWVAQINAASPATVQKETAILLSEINYQLYLMRQQEERMLLTQSVLTLLSLSSSKPSQQINTSSSNPTLQSPNSPTY